MPAIVVDFSNVKDGGEFNPRHMPEGDYPAKITAYKIGKAESTGNDMITFTIALEGKRGTYPYRCTLTEKSLWKLRNLMVAAGISVPKKKLKIDPSRLVGKKVGVELTDDEYEGKLKSIITGVFSPSEFDDVKDDDEDVEDNDELDEDDDEEEEEKPVRRKATAKKKPVAKKKKAPVDEDEDDVDDEDLEELDLDEV